MKLIGFLLPAAVLLFSACQNERHTTIESASENGAVSISLESPGDNITGLAWGNGYLWAVDASTNMIFKMNRISGDVIDSFSISLPRSFSATGLAFSEEHSLLLLGLWDGGYNGYVYQYHPNGDYIGSTSMCGG